MTKTILFMCPHNAAKSVLAAAIAQRLLDERGLHDFVVYSAGTHPDPQIAPAVASYLKENGYPVGTPVPRKFTGEDVQNAHTIVSLGCDLNLLKNAAPKILDWSDVPPPSADLPAAVHAIGDKVEALISQLT
ncbi:MAG: hypothetical protein O3B43_05750 [Chloroflexi bacterium]|nr:hypothetical protein [Chloroflexota bacterium]